MTSTPTPLAQPAQGDAGARAADQSREPHAANSPLPIRDRFAPEAAARALLESVWRVLDTSVALSVLTLVFLAANAGQMTPAWPCGSPSRISCSSRGSSSPGPASSG